MGIFDKSNYIVNMVILNKSFNVLRYQNDIVGEDD